MGKGVDLVRFREEVEARFGFLSEPGFAGPVAEGDTVEYVSERLSVRVTYGGHQHELLTTVRRWDCTQGCHSSTWRRASALRKPSGRSLAPVTRSKKRSPPRLSP